METKVFVAATNTLVWRTHGKTWITVLTRIIKARAPRIREPQWKVQHEINTPRVYDGREHLFRSFLSCIRISVHAWLPFSHGFFNSRPLKGAHFPGQWKSMMDTKVFVNNPKHVKYACYERAHATCNLSPTVLTLLNLLNQPHHADLHVQNDP